MAAVSSTSTVAEIEAAYIDNASYSEDASVLKCRAFITAARVLIIRLPTAAVKGANSLSFDVAGVRSELERAQAWLEAHSTTESDYPGPRVTRSDFRMGRS